TDRMPDGYLGVWDPQTGPDPAWEWCYDHPNTSGHRSDDVTHGSIVWAIEKMVPYAGTNMAEGMREGIVALGTGTGHYGRPNAVKVMLLLTDGVANVIPSGSDPCQSDNQWPDGDSGTAKDCVIYYADVAYRNSIVVYTIGLGGGADRAILEEIADRTGGVYYAAVDPKQLDAIFQQIADQILLRLID
ncbi:MAG: VWA domain-containing protein, partial [Anaerolineae bacterium]|nr:VWA domain-containing protein [Anaerolineae bacterium]